MTPTRASLLPRLAMITVWIAILIWLPFEDRTPAIAVTFGLLLSALFALRIISRMPGKSLVACALGGVAAGLVAGPLSVGLMILKSGLHAHGIPEFTVADITSVLQRTPVYALGGLLLGAGLQRTFSLD